MSYRALPYQPDPSGWIETSHPKKSVQRPLFALTGSLATPPATVRRNATAGPGPSTGRQRLIRETEQSTLRGFLTPPDSTSMMTKKRKLGASGLREEADMEPTGSPVSRASLDTSQRTKGRGSYSVGPSSAASIAAPAVPIADSYLSRDDGSPALRAGARSTEQRITHRAFSTPDQAPEHHLPRVPDYVLDIHRQLCGQPLLERLDRIPAKELGGAQTPPASKKRKKRVEPKEQITRRAQDQACGMGKKSAPLVQSSDEASPRPARVLPLSPIPPNASRRRSQATPSIKKPKPTPFPMTLPPTSSPEARTPASTDHYDNSSHLTPIRGSAHSRRGRSATPLPGTIGLCHPSEPKAEQASLSHHKAITPSPTKGRNPGHGSSSSSTHSLITPPRNPHHHHTTTPPKSTTPTRPRLYEEHHETLFAFPPPRQPHFLSEELLVDMRKSFDPVEMEPETLMTWSIGPPPVQDRELVRRPVIDPLGEAGTRMRSAGELGPESVCISESLKIAPAEHNSSRNPLRRSHSQSLSLRHPTLGSAYRVQHLPTGSPIWPSYRSSPDRY